MKYGLLVCSPAFVYKNIGDYIQSVAQERFLPTVDEIVEREALNDFKSKGGEVIKVIMNGWFMWHPESFPPSHDICPLFISFHLTPKIESVFFNEDTIKYLKKFEPIGARDYNTMYMLQKYGIESYFSGCLTLTLGNSYLKLKSGSGKVLFVDPYYPIVGMKLTLFNVVGYIKNIWYLMKNWKSVHKLSNRFAIDLEFKTVFRFLSASFEKKWCAASFFEHYKSVFSEELLLNAEYISHCIPSSNYNSNEEWMDFAKALILEYTNASFVVTSRIHCGLPCLSVETPCLFILSDTLQRDAFRSSGRFEGLLDLFHVAKCTNKGIIGLTNEIKDFINIKGAGKGKITSNNIAHLSARLEYRKYKDSLIHSVNSFIQDEEV